MRRPALVDHGGRSKRDASAMPVRITAALPMRPDGDRQGAEAGQGLRDAEERSAPGEPEKEEQEPASRVGDGRSIDDDMRPPRRVLGPTLEANTTSSSAGDGWHRDRDRESFGVSSATRVYASENVSQNGSDLDPQRL
jgi:hypothetical protein